MTLTNTSSAATDIIAVDGKTSVEVVATAMTAITGTFAQVKAATITADTANTISTDTDYDATISDASIAATDLIELDGDTSGTVTAQAATITGTATNVLTAIQSEETANTTDYDVL